MRGVGYRLVAGDGRRPSPTSPPTHDAVAAEPTRARGPSLSFQTRLTLTLLAAAIIPLGVFGLLLIASGTVDPQVGSRLLLFMFAIAVAVGILGGAAIGLDLVRPLREISAAVDARLGRRPEPADPGRGQRRPRPAGREPQPPGRRRPAAQPPARADPGRGRIGRAARRRRTRSPSGPRATPRSPFGFISAELRFVDPDSVEAEERIPGVSLPIRAELRAGDERMGLLLASLPATQTWERADQALLDLYAIEIGVAIRNAELFAQVQEKNVQLRQLSEVKDDFLRGVSHNLQTPLTSIKSNAEALAASDPSRTRA